MNDKKNIEITVYAASSLNVAPEYIDVADELGRLIALHPATLVYGGGPNGLMGAVANGALNVGGKVVGVIPRFMIDRGWLHTGLTETIVTPNMHIRKQTMADRADACIALPGGIGTLEELLEILAWRQLGLFTNPVVILNTKGFYDSLLAQFDRIVAEDFLRHSSECLWSVAGTPAEALDIIDRQLQIPTKPLE